MATVVATKSELLGANRDGEPRDFNIASSAVIAKGTLMKFADGRIASASTGTGDVFAGIAAEEKEADYSTKISVWTNGIFKIVASGAIVAGNAVKTADPGNYVIAIPLGQASGASVADLGAATVGYALDGVSDTETAEIRINK